MAILTQDTLGELGMDPGLLQISEHASRHYAPRTYANARRADLTLALALDFTTYGERLTCKAAADRYSAIYLCTHLSGSAVDLLVADMQEHDVRTLNIAGNGISRLVPQGWTQHRANTFVHGLLSRVLLRWTLERVICGGQTGMDLAGLTAAYALKIPAEALLPKGFRQRGIDGQDRAHSEAEIRAQVEAGALQLYRDQSRRAG